jgi:hypothetical protein
MHVHNDELASWRTCQGSNGHVWISMDSTFCKLLHDPVDRAHCAALPQQVAQAHPGFKGCAPCWIRAGPGVLVKVKGSLSTASSRARALRPQSAGLESHMLFRPD